MQSDHARLSPSSAHRWINCPGSVHLAEMFPNDGSDYAAEGTVAHAVAELKLRKAAGEISARTYNSKLKKLTADEYWDGEMDEATDFYAAAVMDRLTDAGEEAVLLIEQQFSLDAWVPESFGTSDAVIISDGAIEVIDLKYGKGVKIAAPQNEQLRLYGLGASALFGNIYNFGTVRTTIVQPRLDHVSTEELPLSELLLWAEEIKPRAVMAMEESDYFAAGDWCRFCPAKALCRTRAEENLALAKEEFKPPQLLTEEEIGNALTVAEYFSKWLKDVQDWALEQALAGMRIAGWKLVEGRSIRKYADEQKVAEKLMEAGFDEAMLYERKLYGIAAMEKLVGKKKFAETLGELLIKPPGKPTLAPESDNRNEINTAESAKNDFKGE